MKNVKTCMSFSLFTGILETLNSVSGTLCMKEIINTQNSKVVKLKNRLSF